MDQEGCNGKKILWITSVILTGLLVLDIIYQGQVYKRLPTSWQDKLSEYIGRT